MLYTPCIKASSIRKWGSDAGDTGPGPAGRRAVDGQVADRERRCEGRQRGLPPPGVHT